MLDKLDLDLLVVELQEVYPSFRVHSSTEQGWVIRGHLLDHGRYNEHTYLVDVEIDIHITSAFPKSVPRVNEVIEYTGPDFHKLKDNALCLGSDLECQIVVGEHPDLVSFIKKLVLPYYFSYHYFQEYGKMPYGERSHIHGQLEFLQEFFGEKDPNRIKKLFDYVLSQKIDRLKDNCACGSGRKLVECHLQAISKIKAYLSERQILDAINLLVSYDQKIKGFLSARGLSSADSLFHY